jgi:ubiquinone/menaquinone biosynthesis C-methylase UbiE
MLHHVLINKYKQFAAHATIPIWFRNTDWDNTTVLKIGGVIKLLDDRIAKAHKIIEVNISPVYHDRNNTVDIQADAHELPMLADDSVDLVASSGTVEHLTNPIKALIEWKRILRPGGVIYAGIPYYKKTFDHRREVTPLEHLIEDYNNNTGLDDQTHMEEFLQNFDASKELVYGNWDEWYANYLTNPQIYTHFHVFDKKLVKEMMEYAGFQTVKVCYNDAYVEYYGRKI